MPMHHTPPLQDELLLLLWDQLSFGWDTAAVLTYDEWDLAKATLGPFITWSHLKDYFEETSDLARTWISPRDPALPTEERIQRLWSCYQRSHLLILHEPDVFAHLRGKPQRCLRQLRWDRLGELRR